MKAAFSETTPYEILSRITDAFFALDTHWRFTYANETAGRLLFKDSKHLIGKTIWDEFPEAVDTPFYYHYHKAIQKQTPVIFQEYYPPLHAWFSVRAYPSENGLSVYFMDITNEIHAKMSADRHYEALFEQNPDAVFSMDLDGNYLSINPAMETLFGYTSDELLYKSFKPLVAKRDQDRVAACFQEAINLHPQSYECIVIAKDGTKIDVQVTNVPIVVDGEVTGVYGIAKDIRKQKAMERHLAESQQRYQSLKKYNPDGICSMNLQGQFIGVNPAFEKLTGYTREELLNMTYSDFAFTHTLEIAHDLFHKLRKMELTTPYEAVIKHKDGHALDVSSTPVPIVINNRLVGLYFIIKDISEQKQTEELLLRSEKLNAVGQLAAAIAHEIRNPLTSLKGFLQLVKSMNDNGNNEYFSIMETELSRIELITSELLVLGKPQAKDFKQANILNLLGDVVFLLESQANMKSIEMNFHHPGGEFLVNCDPNQLKQVFVNIIKNAIEAMNNGGTINISLDKRREDKKILITVVDQGCGIPEDKLKQIGQPFFSMKEKGTGLGMMTTFKIIEAHKGKINMTSKVGLGTTVQVVLPDSDSESTSEQD